MTDWTDDIDWTTEKVSKRYFLALQLIHQEDVPEYAAVMAVAIVEAQYPDEDWGAREKTVAEWAADEAWN